MYVLDPRWEMLQMVIISRGNEVYFFLTLSALIFSLVSFDPHFLDFQPHAECSSLFSASASSVSMRVIPAEGRQMFKVTAHAGGQSMLCQQWQIVTFDDENEVKQKHQKGIREPQEAESELKRPRKVGEWRSKKVEQKETSQEQADRHYRDACRDLFLFLAFTRAGSVSESILLGTWKRLYQPADMWSTFQKSAWPLGTFLYSVGLFSCLFSTASTCFWAFPAGVGESGISVPARCWKLKSSLKTTPL